MRHSPYRTDPTAGFLLKNFKGRKTIDHCFLNDRLLFYLFFLLFREILGGAPLPCSRKPESEYTGKYLASERSHWLMYTIGY